MINLEGKKIGKVPIIYDETLNNRGEFDPWDKKIVLNPKRIKQMSTWSLYEILVHELSHAIDGETEEFRADRHMKYIKELNKLFGKEIK